MRVLHLAPRPEATAESVCELDGPAAEPPGRPGISPTSCRSTASSIPCRTRPAASRHRRARRFRSLLGHTHHSRRQTFKHNCDSDRRIDLLASARSRVGPAGDTLLSTQSSQPRPNPRSCPGTPSRAVLERAHGPLPRRQGSDAGRRPRTTRPLSRARERARCTRWRHRMSAGPGAPQVPPGVR